MDAAEKIFAKLKDEFGVNGAQGQVAFTLKGFSITLNQNNIIGNILEEWLGKWMMSQNIPCIPNPAQESPDFWLNPENREQDWLEIKAFTGSPNFDVAAFMSFIHLIIEKPYKLHSKHLLIKYSMKDTIVTIDDCWLKNVWEICTTSDRWPLKVQCKKDVIYNIRPATWYSNRAGYPVFKSLEHFLAALEETVYKYSATRHLASDWKDKVVKSYYMHYGVMLEIPRWNDIKGEYIS